LCSFLSHLQLTNKHTLASNTNTNTVSRQPFRVTQFIPIFATTQNTVSTSHTKRLCPTFPHKTTLTVSTQKTTLPNCFTQNNSAQVFHTKQLCPFPHTQQLCPTFQHKTTLPVSTHKTTLPVSSHKTTLPVSSHKTTLPVSSHKTTLPVSTQNNSARFLTQNAHKKRYSATQPASMGDLEAGNLLTTFHFFTSTQTNCVYWDGSSVGNVTMLRDQPKRTCSSIPARGVHPLGDQPASYSAVSPSV
jgi:hypothetical protein